MFFLFRIALICTKIVPCLSRPAHFGVQKTFRKWLISAHWRSVFVVKALKSPNQNLQSLTIMMMKPPSAFRLPQLGAESPPELITLHKLCDDARSTNQPKVLYDGKTVKSELADSSNSGPVRQICQLAPDNLYGNWSLLIRLKHQSINDKMLISPFWRNALASAAIAAHNLGFDNTRTKLIVDPLWDYYYWNIKLLLFGQNIFF